MTYTAKRPYRLFKNEAQRVAFEEMDWEAAGHSARGRVDAFLQRLVISRMPNLPAEGTPEYERAVNAAVLTAEERAERKLTEIAVTHRDSDWAIAGRSARERTKQFFARHAAES